jgi:nitrogen fixation/metabolism regulation signal transduction histidine kinase
LNHTNRQISYFFNAIRNEDSALHFPIRTKNKVVNELNSSMNRLNELISEAKMQNRSQEQYYQTILELAATGLLTYDDRGNVLLANSTARRLLGCEPLTHLQQLEKVQEGLSAEFEHVKTTGHKLVNLTNERGSMQLSLRSTSMVAQDQHLTLLSIQDIRNELDEKETESWIRLIRVLTHEIMNSIAPITSLSETMSGYFIGKDGPRMPLEIDDVTIRNTIKGLGVIQERGKGLVGFVNSYRRLTHLHTPEYTTFNLLTFLDKTKMLICAELDFSKVKFSINLQTPEMALTADENLLLQVIINLARNSWEALRDEDNGMIMIQAAENDNHQTVIEIIDNGPGIPAELLDKIFVPFFTTRENGSGIGLSLSRQIMRLHGGSLTVQSIPGRTCFSIVL